MTRESDIGLVNGHELVRLSEVKTANSAEIIRKGVVVWQEKVPGEGAEGFQGEALSLLCRRSNGFLRCG
jgi:hypothetical protein